MPWLIPLVHSLLAQAAGDSAVAQPPAREAPLSTTAIALCIGALALVALAAMIVSWLLSAAARREANSPRRLLGQLCEAHGFARRERAALISAAGVLGIDQPARLFLESRLLDAAAGHPRLKRQRRELLKIAGELFDKNDQ